MVLPPTIPTPPPRAIATFDAIDFADGTGRVIFLASKGSTEDGSNEFFILGRDAVHSEKIEETETTLKNFDLTPFNTPRTVRGTAIVSVAIASAGTAHVLLRVYKNSTPISAEVNSSRSSEATGKMFLVPIPLTETHFKKGDFLRIEVTLVKDVAGNAAFGMDPIGRTGTQLTGSTITTKFQFIIPFRIGD